MNCSIVDTNEQGKAEKRSREAQSCWRRPGSSISVGGVRRAKDRRRPDDRQRLVAVTCESAAGARARGPPAPGLAGQKPAPRTEVDHPVHRRPRTIWTRRAAPRPRRSSFQARPPHTEGPRHANDRYGSRPRGATVDLWCPRTGPTGRSRNPAERHRGGPDRNLEASAPIGADRMGATERILIHNSELTMLSVTTAEAHTRNERGVSD